MAQDRFQWMVLVNMVISIKHSVSIKGEEFLDKLSKY